MSEIFGTCNYCGAQLNTFGCPNMWCSSKPKPTDYEEQKARFCASCALWDQTEALSAQMKKKDARIAELEARRRTVICTWCGERLIFDSEQIDADVLHMLQGHDRECQKNPLSARVADLEAQLAAKTAECKRLETALNDGAAFAFNRMKPRTVEEIRDTPDEQLVVLEASYRARGEALAAKTAECERLRNENADKDRQLANEKFQVGYMLKYMSKALKSELKRPTDAVHAFEVLVGYSAGRDEQLAAARAECERLWDYCDRLVDEATDMREDIDEYLKEIAVLRAQDTREEAGRVERLVSMLCEMFPAYGGARSWWEEKARKILATPDWNGDET